LAARLSSSSITAPSQAGVRCTAWRPPSSSWQFSSASPQATLPCCGPKPAGHGGAMVAPS
jgi:hypothetical protein